ncbi:MAG TPA: hypothetical protein VHR65_09460 [Solirubrobacterales bacterium]|jgi:hypothetical protein|nr:hypothetical protein [Solirubrobacterales bacterium]
MSERVILATAVGAASGSKAAAAAIACAGSAPDRPGLLIDVGGRPPRPTLVASAGARELEERLAVHLPQLRAASRGQTCHLAVADDPVDFASVRAALPLVRDSVAVLHLPPALLQGFLGPAAVSATGVMLRADLTADRSLTALAVRELLGRDLRVRVLKRPLAWIPARRALFGLLPTAAPGGLPPRFTTGVFEKSNPLEHGCYDGEDGDAEIDPAGTEEQQRRDHARARRRRGLHRHAEREAGR